LATELCIDFGIDTLAHRFQSMSQTKCPQRNNLCNLLVIGISIGDLDCENQDVQ